jgi:8-oxo-dGTP diphosphatase
VITRHVVAAVVIHDGRVFAAQRGYGKFKDKWEFPGGKIEPGETPQQALAREIREELAVEVEVGDLLDTIETDYPDFHLSMGCYLCRVRSGQFMLLEHETARWLDAEHLDSVDWLPADRSLLDKIRPYL